MTPKMKMKKSKKKAKNPDQGNLLAPPDCTYKQDKIDGSGPLRETASKDVQEAADYWFGKRVEEARAKDNSKEWQKVMLPVGLKGSDELKAAADCVCRRLFPDMRICAGGGDSLMIAQYLKNKKGELCGLSRSHSC